LDSGENFAPTWELSFFALRFSGRILVQTHGVRGRRIVATAKEYRAYAAECMEAAKTAKTEEEREAFLEMATNWLRAASLAEPMTSARPRTPPSARHPNTDAIPPPRSGNLAGGETTT
jgi:hypothetical protein